jgi:hypothetical protein
VASSRAATARACKVRSSTECRLDLLLDGILLSLEGDQHLRFVSERSGSSTIILSFVSSQFLIAKYKRAEGRK